MINPIFYVELRKQDWFKLLRFCMRNCVCWACLPYWEEWTPVQAGRREQRLYRYRGAAEE